MENLKIETGLAGYLEKDAAVVEESLKVWEPEYTALSRLVAIFRRIAQLVEIKDKDLSVPAQLFLLSVFMRRLVLVWRRVLAVPLLNVPSSSVFSIVLREAPREPEAS